jgi:hypothetical protein
VLCVAFVVIAYPYVASVAEAKAIKKADKIWELHGAQIAFRRSLNESSFRLPLRRTAAIEDCFQKQRFVLVIATANNVVYTICPLAAGVVNNKESKKEGFLVIGNQSTGDIIGIRDVTRDVDGD